MLSHRVLIASCLVVAALTANPALAQPAKPKDGPLGMKFVPLPKATFYMGWDGKKGSAKKTEIEKDFEIAIHTVTQGQWQEVMGKNPSYFSRDGEGKNKVKDIKDEDLKHFPVETVSWTDAQEFIKKLNEKEKGKGYQYRLPSEVEWEYACRGGATSEEECSYLMYFAKPTNTWSLKDFNFKADKGPDLGRTTKVGSYAPNKLGLYDMHGNVQQWCEDLWKKGGPDRVIRGCAWGYHGGNGIASARFSAEPSALTYFVGFRLVRVPVRGQAPKPKDGPLGMKFVPLPKATFYMGWDGKKGSAKKTEVEKDFEIAIHTVTQGQWQEVMGKNPSYFSRAGRGKDKVKDINDEDLKHFPVEQVSWYDAQEFIKKLNEKEKGKGYQYRLPSEVEWEYACRGGATSEEECSYHFYFAKPTNDLSSKEANFDGNFPFGKADKGPYLQRTTKVGSYAPNKVGLYDMHGNVWQWCEDVREKGASTRVFRGGCWIFAGIDCRAAVRQRGVPGTSAASLGFRLARVPVR